MEVADERSEFLRHLPPGTSEYQYSRFSTLEEVVTHEYTQFVNSVDGHKSPFVVFNGISPSEIEKHQEQFPGKTDYSYLLQTLVLTMLSLPHENGAQRFETLLQKSLREMQVERETMFWGATSLKTGDRNKRGKEADRSWSARVRTGRGTSWPTVVLEVGFSETREKLKQDALWWLGSSADVQRVITLDIKRPSGNIYITAWERGGNSVQQIQIYRGKHGHGPHVVGDDLKIPFSQLLNREPNSSHGEHDIFLKKDDLLEDMADRIWESMDLMS